METIQILPLAYQVWYYILVAIMHGSSSHQQGQQQWQHGMAIHAHPPHAGLLVLDASPRRELVWQVSQAPRAAVAVTSGAAVWGRHFASLVRVPLCAVCGVHRTCQHTRGKIHY